MLDRYTEKARRTVYVASQEAKQFRATYIETEHILLGLLSVDKTLANRFFRSQAIVRSIRKQIEAHTSIRDKIFESGNLPLSNESKRVLAYAADEAERLGDKLIGTEHLLIGLLREEKSFAAELLYERGLRLRSVREELKPIQPEKAQFKRVERSVSPDFTLTFASDLTPDQINSTLHALADYYRACGGVGFEIDFQLQDILVGEPASV